MPTHPVVSSIKFCATRVTRLNTATLAPVVSATAGYCTHAQVSMDMDPQYESIDAQTATTGCDNVILRLPEKRRFTGFNLSFNSLLLEAALQEILVGGALIVDSTNTVGFSWPDQLGQDSAEPPIVGFEGWSQAYINSTPMASTPYIRWVFPAVSFAMDTRTLEAATMQEAVVGYQQPSSAWPDAGPYADQPDPVGRMGGWMFDDAIPAATNGGYITISS